MRTGNIKVRCPKCGMSYKGKAKLNQTRIKSQFKDTDANHAIIISQQIPFVPQRISVGLI